MMQTQEGKDISAYVGLIKDRLMEILGPKFNYISEALFSENEAVGKSF